MITLILLAGLLCAVVVLWYLRRWWLLRKTANIPTLPREVPFFGHVLNFFCDSMGLWDLFQFSGNTTNALGGVTKIWMGPLLCFYITDPAVAKEVMNVTLSKMFLYKYFDGWLGRGLVTSNVKTWKRHRKLLIPSFNQQMLNKFFSIIDKEAENLIMSLEEKVGKGEFDSFDYINKYALDSASQTLLGLSGEVKTLGIYNEYGNLVPKLFHLATSRLQHMWTLIEPLYNWTKMKKEEMRIVKRLVTMSSNIIEERKSTFHRATDGRCKPFLDILLEHEADNSMTFQEIREEVDTIFGASSDTTTTTMIYTLVMVGSFPEVQEKLHNELKTVFKESDRAMTKDDLPLLVYTEAVIKEVMRLFPIAPMIARYLRKDAQIGKYKFLKGCNVIVDIRAMHTNLSWGDPENFRPERWLGPENTNENAYAPFSMGKRACIGKGYAMIMLKTTLVHLMRRYTVRSDHRRLRSQWSVVLSPAAGSEISIENRV